MMDIFSITNSKNEILTARENSKLLEINTEMSKNNLKIIYKNESKVISLNQGFQDIQLSLFKQKVVGEIIHSETNIWLTEIFKLESKLRKTNNTKISFNDLYPIHLISVESNNSLNKKSENHIGLNGFSPNIIVSGIKPFEGENWTNVIIRKFSIIKTKRGW